MQPLGTAWRRGPGGGDERNTLHGMKQRPWRQQGSWPEAPLVIRLRAQPSDGEQFRAAHAGKRRGFGWVPKIPDLDDVAHGFLQGARGIALVCGRNVHGSYVAADCTPDESNLSVTQQRWTTEIRADLGFRIAFVAEVDRHEHHSRLCATMPMVAPAGPGS